MLNEARRLRLFRRKKELIDVDMKAEKDVRRIGCIALLFLIITLISGVYFISITGGIDTGNHHILFFILGTNMTILCFMLYVVTVYYYNLLGTIQKLQKQKK